MLKLRIIHSALDQSIQNGTLLLFANLLFDTVFIGWIIFGGLYLLEVILPTFIIARLSLVKYFLFLFFLTSLLALLRNKYPA